MRLLFRRSIGLLILLTFSTLVRRGYAQIITDGTIGGAGSLHGPHYLIPSSLGQVYGSNLFQSFKCFNLSPGESATFSGPSSIRNILSRVTGGEPSLINGLLTSSVPGANFFFVNPQGVVFGPHGKVAISGSLVVTTASFLRLKNGGIFKAWHPGDEVLTSAPPAAFGFLNPHPAAIQLNGTNLQVQDSKALSIIGGPVQLNGGDLDAPRGTLDLVSLGSIGEVGLHGEGTSVRKWGSVIISKDAFVGADNGGTISVRGGTLLVDHAGLGIGNIGSGSGANINLNLQMDLKLTNGAVLSTGNYFTERPNRNHSPTIWIEARNIVLEKASWLSNDYSKDTGAPGSIYIRANRMRISGESKVSMDTFSNGSGGHLMIQADAMQIDGPGTSAKDLTGIETKTLSKDAAAQGTSIILDARILTISRGGVVQSSTTAAAKAGNISIHADAVRLNGQSTRTDQFTGIGSQTDSSSTTAKGGNIEVDANSVALIHDGGIGTATVGKARAGDIKIHCQSLLVDGTGEIQFTGIGSQTDSSSTTAKGGNIEVDANSVALIHRGQMSADTFGAGNGGSITVRAKRILINGQGANKHQVTGISASTQQEQHGGNGGNINLIVDHLNISQHGEISADTFGDGVGGNINIQAANVLATGQDVSGRLFTGISAGTDSKQHGGRGGNIDIFTKSMSIRQGAEVRANSRGNGIGGNIKIHAQNIAVAGQDNEDQVTAITAETDELGQGGDGGSIIIEVHNLTVLRAGEITAGTSGAGNGGDVRIHADTLQIDGQGVGGDLFTGIGADTESTVHGGRGGNIALNIKNLSLKHGGEVSANSFGSGNSGDITVNAHAIFIDGQGSNMQATGIAAETDNTTNGGAGGHLRLNTQQLDIRNGGNLSTTSFGSGAGGDITVAAQNILLDGENLPGHNIQTGILARTESAVGGGPGGNIDISSNHLKLTGAIITSTTLGSGQGGNILIKTGDAHLIQNGQIASMSQGRGNAGQITLRCSGSLLLDKRSSLETAAVSAAGGNMNIVASDLIRLQDSTITAQAGQNGGGIRLHGGHLIILRHSQISAQAGGNGGNLEVGAGFTVLDHSQIKADAVHGNGGNITVQANVLVPSSDSEITASSKLGIAGTILIDAPHPDLGAALLRLPANPLSAQDYLQERCLFRHTKASSFIVGRQGLVPPTPSHGLPSWSLK